jgi:raffinose/stachyose/melibiose transport system permease protein
MYKKILGGSGSALKYLLLLAVFVISFYPVLWMIAGSLKTTSEFFLNIWGAPQNPDFTNYITAWDKANLGTKYINSILITLGFLAIIIPTNCCVSYALARLEFKGRSAIYSLLLTGIMIPGGVLAIPVFSVLLRLGLVNTKIGLILAYSGQMIAFGMFVMRSFFISLPKSIEEAAYIDGCKKFNAFLYIVMPLARAGVMVQVIYCGLNVWNEYLLASITLRSEKLTTIPVGLAVFVGRYNVDYPPLFAALACATLPMIVIYCLSQKSFIEGMTAGAVKG